MKDTYTLISEGNGNFKMVATDMTPFYCDNTDADALDAENWVVEKLEQDGVDVAKIINIATFATADEARAAWASWLNA